MTNDFLPLIQHSASPPREVTAVTARVLGADDFWLRLRWRIDGALALVVPPFAGKGRADELWRTTCFELFLMPEGRNAYCEFNLSPSERWAAYDFSGYREGMSERPVEREPQGTMRLGSSFAIFDATIPLSALPAGNCRMNVTAVIEEHGGVKSYWALAHPAGKADFHDPACFVATLPAPKPA
ncbi:MAG TPA: DOMON-like domain-containing protein [Croceibacterium sp.]|nr:DOMON-like domain-containing protein [Croceibacterium sp.]